MYVVQEYNSSSYFNEQKSLLICLLVPSIVSFKRVMEKILDKPSLKQDFKNSSAINFVTQKFGGLNELI